MVRLRFGKYKSRGFKPSRSIILCIQKHYYYTGLTVPTNNTYRGIIRLTVYRYIHNGIYVLYTCSRDPYDIVMLYSVVFDRPTKNLKKE